MSILRQLRLPLAGLERMLASRAERAAELGFQPVFPRGFRNGRAWHATAREDGSSWPLHGRIDLTRGEGFGFHAGTRRAAQHRIKNEGGDPVFLDLVARPGREIETPDLNYFSSPIYWRSALRDNKVKGLTPAERTTMHDLADNLINEGRSLGTPEAGALFRDKLLSMGVDRLRYINGVEDRGSTSFAFLDPSKLRWYSRAEFDEKRLSDPNLLAQYLLASLGGGAGVLSNLHSRGDDA